MRLRLEEEMRSTRQISADKASLEKANKRGSMVDVPEPTSPAANVDSYGFFSEDKTAVIHVTCLKCALTDTYRVNLFFKYAA